MLSPTSNDDMAISPDDLQLIQRVGAGGQGEVWKAKWRGRGGGITVAVKKVPVNKTNASQQREVLVEVGIHLNLLSLCPLIFICCSPYLFICTYFYTHTHRNIYIRIHEMHVHVHVLFISSI